MNGSYTKGIPFVLVSGELIIEDGKANIDKAPGKPIRYEPITEGKIELDFGDKPFQWHADLEGKPEHREFPDKPARLSEDIPGAPNPEGKE